MKALPAWSHWNPAAADAPWTVGIEEEVMLLDPRDWSLASRSGEVLPALSAAVESAGSTSPLRDAKIGRAHV